MPTVSIVRRLRAAPFAVAAFFVSMLFASTVSAQTFYGTIPSGTSWGRPDGAGCPYPQTTRNYRVVTVQPSGYGNVTITATRVGGAVVAIDVYRFSMDPSNPCNGRTASETAIGNGTASLTLYMETTYRYAIVVSSASTVDSGAFTLAFSGQPVDGYCTDAAAALSPTTQAAAIGGGSYATTFTTTTTPECYTWRVSSVPVWVTGFPASGTGTATFNYTVAANSGPPRVANILVGQDYFQISQAGTCNYSLSATSATVSGAGESGLFLDVSTASTCSFTATSNAGFIHVQSGGGLGSGRVTLNIDANGGSARSGTVTIAGQTFTVNQNAACSYTLGSSSIVVGAAASMQSVDVTTQLGCPRGGTTSSSFLTPSASGAGSGPSYFGVAANTSIARVGTIAIADQTLTVSQEAGCAVATGGSSATVAASGGTSAVIVSTGAGCTYSVVSNAAWLTATKTGSGFDFTAPAWPGGARSGTVTVSSGETSSTATFTVMQANGCTVTLDATGAPVPAIGSADGTVTVTTDAQCAIAASSVDSFVHPAVTAGGVSYTVDSNTGPARSGTIVITASGSAPAMYTVMQASGCEVTDAEATYTVPASTSFPIPISVVLSNPACTVSVTANASWLSVDPGASSSSFYLDVSSNVGAARTGSVTVTPTDGGEPFVLTIVQPSAVTPPTIIAGPRSETVDEHDSVLWTVTALGSGLEYQWLHDGVPIVGATSSTYSIDSVETTDEGEYTVVVSNLGGSVTAGPASLVVTPSPAAGCATTTTDASVGPLAVAIALAAWLAARRRARA